MGLKPFEELQCKGSHREMGLLQGLWMQPRLDHLFRSLVNNSLAPGWTRYLGPKVVQGLLALKGIVIYERHIHHMGIAAKSQIERLQGIAEGADISLYSLLGITSIETMAAHMQFILGCTSLGIAPHRSKTKRPLLGYNHDFPSFLRDHILVRKSYPETGFASVQLTYPALPGSICGVNAAGLALTLNHAFTTEPFNQGVPPTFMVQEALDHCRTIDEVVRSFEEVTFSCGSLVTVVDERGDMCVMELSRERFGVRGAKNGICLALNDYQVESLREIEVPSQAKFHPKKYPKVFHGYYVHQHNWERHRRFNELLTHDVSWGVSELKTCLSDHAERRGSIGTICRHHGTVDTIATAVLNPVERSIEVGRGHACRAHYQKYDIA